MTKRVPAFAPSLDGREFIMESSTNSLVDVESPSRFRYSERDGVIWGDYEGDTVAFGRFVGTRIGDDLAVTFAHVILDDHQSVVTGTGASRVEVDAEGRLRLVEDFTLDGVAHVSVCTQI